MPHCNYEVQPRDISSISAVSADLLVNSPRALTPEQAISLAVDWLCRMRVLEMTVDAARESKGASKQ